jgi:hypothetical protein
VDSRTKRILVIAGVIAAAALAAVVAMVALGGGDKTATKAEYQATIVNARDRVDYGYAQITKADSVENLIERLDTASVIIGEVADDVDAAAVAPGFGELNADLAARLAKFSGALAAVADQFADPTSAGLDLGSMTSLGFGEWDDVNAVLTSMKEQGLKVELLERH